MARHRGDVSTSGLNQNLTEPAPRAITAAREHAKGIESMKAKHWRQLALLTSGACVFQIGGCIEDILFVVAPFIL
jgi:hypothetical protein